MGPLRNNGSPVLENLQVINNSVSYQQGGHARPGGAGLWIQGGSTSLRHAVIANNHVSSNAHPEGGGIAVRYGELLMEHVVISGNTVDNPNLVVWDAAGGGIHATDADLTFSHGALLGNEVSTGGVPGPGGGLHSVLGSAALDHVVIAWNASATGGAGIEALGSAVSLASSDVYLNSIVGIADPVGSNGNVAVAPEFAAASPSQSWPADYHLDPNSPLIDAGDDLDPDGGPADIGPFGGADAGQWDLDGDGWPAWWQPGPYESSSYPGLGLDCVDTDHA